MNALHGRWRWLISAGSFMIFVATFSFLLSWQLSIVFGLLLLVHEFGHYLVCRWKKFSATPPVFIPFLGAFIAIDPSKMDSNDEALVGYGGPFFGSVAAMALFPVWLFWPGCPDVLLLGSCAALLLNFINLVPLRPLDGGRITQAISPWLRYLGLLAIAALFLVNHNPIFWLIMLMILYAQTENGQIFKCRALLIGATAMAVSTSFNHLPTVFWIVTAYTAAIYVWQRARLSKVKEWANLRDEQGSIVRKDKEKSLKEMGDEIDLNRSFMTTKQLQDFEALIFKEGAGWEELENKINKDKALADTYLHGVRKQLPSIRRRIAWACCYLGTAVALAMLILVELAYLMRMSLV